MRRIIAYTALTFVGCAVLPATSVPESLTLLLQFEKPASERTMSEMKRELEAILKDGGIDFGVRLFSELDSHSEFRELIVVRVRGECRIDARPVFRHEAGPLGFSHTSDGQVLPFMEVLCDRVRSSVRAALRGDQIRQADEYLGRGLARVMAHEMYHILGKTCKHGSGALAKHALTPQQLVGDRLSFHPADLERMTAGGG